MSNSTKVFLVIDDHVVIRTAMKMIIQNTFGQVNIEEASDGESAMQRVKQHQLFMIIMDVNMPNTDSFALVQNILALQPTSRILMFSMNSEEVYAKRYLRMGVKGYLMKDAPEEDIKKALIAVSNNRRYISGTLAESLVNDAFNEQPQSPFELLSPREFEVLRHVLNGLSVTEICKQLHLNASTISTHKNKIYQKLGVKNMIEANRLAQSFEVI